MADISLTPGEDIFPNATQSSTTTGDTIRGLAGNDVIVGGTGPDLIYGNEGGDLIVGGSADDTSNETIFGNQGSDTLYGGYGNDTIYGGKGNDLLEGDITFSTQGTIAIGSGNDYLIGGKGADTLAGSQGNDTVFGGPGADIFTTYAAGTYLVTDFNVAEDRFGIPEGLTFNDLTITQGTGTNANNALISYNQDGQQLVATILNVQASSLNESAFTILDTETPT